MTVLTDKVVGFSGLRGLAAAYPEDKSQVVRYTIVPVVIGVASFCLEVYSEF